MKKRVVYLVAFLLLLAVEIMIGLYVRDAFVRPYLGDVLVTVLLCVLVRIFLPEGMKLLPVWVFLFAAAVEIAQLLALPKLLGLEDTVFAVITGSVFDWKDIVCYGAGCVSFGAAQWLWSRGDKQK